MPHEHARTTFGGRIVMLGFGSIGQAVLPLLLRHLELPAAHIEILKPSEHGLEAARAHGVRHAALRLTQENLRASLAPRLQAGDLLLNLSVEVESRALIALCQERDALYLDTCTEPWPGAYTQRAAPAVQRTNYRLREEVLALRRPGTPTALITLGANPGPGPAAPA